jgi:uncharacterized GH25 family protein
MRDLLLQGKLAPACLLVPLLASLAVAGQPVEPQKASPKTVVRGTVVDEMGKLVAGASVRGVALWTQRQGSVTTMGVFPVPERRTDERGAFTFELNGAKTELAIHLSARKENAFTARALEIRGDDLEKPIKLPISPRHARALHVRVMDEDGKPVAGATVVVRHRLSGPSHYGQNENEPVNLPKDSDHLTDRAGRLATPPCLAPDGSYQLELSAEGFLADKTPWKEMTAAPEIKFEATLRRLRPLEGQVLDRQGKPVAGARVVRSDERQKVETVTDESGRFQLTSAFFPVGFLFVSKSGFRFHGQRCDRPEPLKITLLHREESQPRIMTTLPPALPRAERKELAARLLEPLLRQTSKADDGTRAQPLRALGRLDPGRLLAELDRRPMQNAWFDAYVRRAAVQGLSSEAREEAQAIIESMKDPSFRSTAYLDLCDAVPEAKKAERRTLLHQALLHARGIQESDHRIINLASVARRLWAIGDKELATKLLREGQQIARELPTAGWSGYARGAFAEDLALIDLDAALALMKDLKDPREYIRHHGNLTHKLANIDPASTERVYRMLMERKDNQTEYQRDQYAVHVCHRMALVDPARARKIAETVINPYFKARGYGVMAQALARSQPREARSLLDHAFDLLEKQAASGQDMFNNFWDASSLAGLMLPAAESIDPSLVPEFFWRALSLYHSQRRDGADDQWQLLQQTHALGALALVLARYDREVALVFIDAAGKYKPSGRMSRSTHLSAAALVEPRRAAALVEKLPEGESKEHARLNVVNMLLAEGDDAWKIVHRDLAQWFVDDEEL